MKPIVIFSGGATAKTTALPLWIKPEKPKTFASPEDFIQSGLKHLNEDSVLILLGNKIPHAMRLLRRYPATALACIAAIGGEQMNGIDVDASDPDSIKERIGQLQASFDQFHEIELSGDIGDQSMILFLRYLTSRGLSRLVPTPDLNSPFGYSYPLCGIFFNDALETWPNDFVRLGLFAKKFFEVTHVCPHCVRYNLNFREVCQECHSSNIGIGEILHHFACGYTGPESSFIKGDELICQKCKTKLRHLGIDYDRPTQFYHCRSCEAVFPEPENDATCFACGRTSKLAELREYLVYDYLLTEEAYQVAKAGFLSQTTAQAQFDQELGQVYSFEFFREFTKIELRRLNRYGGKTCVLGLLMDFPKGKSLSFKRLHQMVWRVARELRENLRDCDLLAKATDRLYLAMLTHTPRENLHVVLERLQKKLNEIVNKFGGEFLIHDLTDPYFSLLDSDQLDLGVLTSKIIQGVHRRNGNDEEVGDSGE